MRPNRRRSPRKPENRSIRIIPETSNRSGDPLTVQLIDISREGAALNNPQGLQTGLRFAIELGGETPKVLIYEVVRCEQMSTTTFRIGARCVQRLQTEQTDPAALERIRKAILS